MSLAKCMNNFIFYILHLNFVLNINLLILRLHITITVIYEQIFISLIKFKKYYYLHPQRPTLIKSYYKCKVL